MADEVPVASGQWPVASVSYGAAATAAKLPIRPAYLYLLVSFSVGENANCPANPLLRTLLGNLPVSPPTTTSRNLLQTRPLSKKYIRNM